MSIKYNGKLIAGKYKTQIVTDATEGNKGLIRIATLEEVNAGTDNTTAVTPKGLATKQNKLTAGTGIEITEDNVINNTQTSAEWGNIQGDIINQSDLIGRLDKKQDVITDIDTIRINAENAAKQTLENITSEGEQKIIDVANANLPIGSDTQKGIVQADNITIESNGGVLTSIATKTKSNTIKIDWEGTNAEYEAGIANGSISSDWYCYITDDETMVDFNDFANNSLSNLSETGETHFDNKYLGTYNITNCLLEVPQRIKYGLADGTLTIKAGSVVIVPYGTEDLTAQYPVGSTFLNDNFKVYDTQFADGKFFVWAGIQNDISRQVSGTLTSEFFVQVSITRNLYWIPNKDKSTSGEIDGTTAGACFYNTATNLCKNYDNASDVTALPCMIIQGDGTYITGKVIQVFNGMGYIGSTVWVDKGVKGLIPNGRNEDGSLKSIEYLNSELKTYDNSNVVNTSRSFVLKQNGTFTRASSYKVNDDGYLVNSDGVYTDGFVCGDIVFGSNSITSFNPKLPFRAVDYNDYVNDIDGEWVGKSSILVNNATYPTSKNTVIDLSNLLPNDNNIYEILLEADTSTGTETGNYCNTVVKSPYLNATFSVSSCKNQSTIGAIQQVNGCAIIPIGANKKLEIVANKVYVGKYTLQLKAYRKVR